MQTTRLTFNTSFVGELYGLIFRDMCIAESSSNTLLLFSLLILSAIQAFTLS